MAKDQIVEDPHFIPAHYQRWFGMKRGNWQEKKPFYYDKENVKNSLIHQTPKANFVLEKGFLTEIDGYSEDFIEKAIWGIDNDGHKIINKEIDETNFEGEIFSFLKDPKFFQDYIRSLLFRRILVFLFNEDNIKEVEKFKILDEKYKMNTAKNINVFNTHKEAKNYQGAKTVGLVKEAKNIYSNYHWYVVKMKTEIISGSSLFYCGDKIGNFSRFRYKKDLDSSHIILIPLRKDVLLVLSRTEIKKSSLKSLSYKSRHINSLVFNESTKIFGKEEIIRGLIKKNPSKERIKLSFGNKSVDRWTPKDELKQSEVDLFNRKTITSLTESLQNNMKKSKIDMNLCFEFYNDYYVASSNISLEEFKDYLGKDMKGKLDYFVKYSDETAFFTYNGNSFIMVEFLLSGSPNRSIIDGYYVNLISSNRELVVQLGIIGVSNNQLWFHGTVDGWVLLDERIKKIKKYSIHNFLNFFKDSRKRRKYKKSI